MLRKSKKIPSKASELIWYEFSLLQRYPHLHHAVFTRSGGVSLNAYKSLNVGLSCGDSEENVVANRAIVHSFFEEKIPGFQLILQHQVHGDRIEKITSFETKRAPSDALMTAELGKGLLVQHADCQAAIFYDPIHHVVANVHSGWRGSVQNIYAKTIEAMQREYNSKPEELIACISPSLGPEKSEFIHYEKELPESFWKFQIAPFYFDFWQISHTQLLECGIQEDHIEIAKICTFLSDDFFSYRRDKMCGRNATVVALGTIA